MTSPSHLHPWLLLFYPILKVEITQSSVLSPLLSWFVFFQRNSIYYHCLKHHLLTSPNFLFFTSDLFFWVLNLYIECLCKSLCLTDISNSLCTSTLILINTVSSVPYIIIYPVVHDVLIPYPSFSIMLTINIQSSPKMDENQFTLLGPSHHYSKSGYQHDLILAMIFSYLLCHFLPQPILHSALTIILKKS